MNGLATTHLALAALATCGATRARAWALALALGSTVGVDLVFIFARGWPRTTLASLIGPAAVILTALLTFRAPKRLLLALLAPVAALTPILLLLGPQLGSTGIAWVIAAAHVYAGAIGLTALFLAHHRAPRLHARLVALFVATCAPSAFGWTCRAFGASMRPAAYLDCVFLAAIVVWSASAWARRQST